MAAIVATPDPVVRNLRITQGYHELARALDPGVGPGANWCAFAVWASKQAGQTIRGEDPWRFVERELAVAPEVTDALLGVAAAARPLGVRVGLGELRSLLLGALELDAARRRTADALARGNARVFQEVGGAAAGFLQAGAGGDPGGFARFLDGFRRGKPPGGQDYLGRAFARYHALSSEAALPSEAARTSGAGPTRRAEGLLLANLEIGVHEQIRLQPELAEAVNSPLPDAVAFRERLLGRLLPGVWLRMRVWVWRRLGRPAPLDRAVEALAEAVRRVLRRALTRRIMTLELAGGVTLRLGEDLPGVFPETLSRLEDPELRDFLAEIDPTPDSVAGTGAHDWEDLGQRLHFIADLFRCYQELPGLLDPPFLPGQVEEIRKGLRPPGRL